jgi:exosortase
MIISSAVYAASLRAKIGYPQTLSIVSMIAGIVLLMRGWRTLWITLFPICFLVLALPPPERMYRQITQPLQQGAAALATMVLNCFPGADVERMGINISYSVVGHGAGAFTVAGACSGMRSLMAFVAIGLMLAYLTPRPAWHRIAMALVVVPVAFFWNVMRVVATGVFQMYGYGDLAAGTPHMVLGLMTFALGFVTFLAILWVLDHLFVEQVASKDLS